MDQSKIEWHAFEYVHKERSDDWFWTIGIFGIAIAIIALILGSILFCLFILIATFCTILFAHRPPRQVKIEITNKGIRVEKTLHPYSSIESFWIDEHGYSKILLKSKKVAMPYIVIPIEEIDPERVREFLIQHIDEKEQQESFAHKLLEYIGL